ncbi:MAG: hemin uptake protein HemP [Reyranellaceae bacterium]
MSGAADGNEGEEKDVNQREIHGEQAARQPNLPRLRSTDLLSGSREAIIEHGQDQYRLRLTSNGKLILTK